MSPPKQMIDLSKMYWNMVDVLIVNGFKEIEAKNIILSFIHDFEPLKRIEIE